MATDERSAFTEEIAGLARKYKDTVQAQATTTNAYTVRLALSHFRW
ncbi:hypothetical protein [Streptomyces sp. NPDC088766]